jgi:hypothetical protein
MERVEDREQLLDRIDEPFEVPGDAGPSALVTRVVGLAVQASLAR